MDTRAAISGILSLTCILGAILLAALPPNTNTPQVIDACVFLASTFGGYVVGLYSMPTKRNQLSGGNDNDS